MTAHLHTNIMDKLLISATAVHGVVPYMVFTISCSSSGCFSKSIFETMPLQCFDVFW